MNAQLNKDNDNELVEKIGDFSVPICNSSYTQEDDYGKKEKSSGKHTGQGGHKRKLERDRRNLINTRFVELAIELQRNENGHKEDRRFMKRPKIDKEAILKEAVMRLVVQRREISNTMARLNDLLAQIDVMRIKMEDLRNDKSLLYSDIRQLSKSNKRFWNLICDASMTSAQELKKAPSVDTNHVSLEAPVQTQPKATCTSSREMTPSYSFGSLIPSIKNPRLPSLETQFIQSSSPSKQTFDPASDEKQWQNNPCDKSLIFGTPMTPAQDFLMRNNSVQVYDANQKNLDHFNSNSRPFQNQTAGRTFLS